MGLDPRKPSGPAVFTPRQQAGHKTVPDLMLKLQKNPCIARAIHTGHGDLNEISWDTTQERVTVPSQSLQSFERVCCFLVIRIKLKRMAVFIDRSVRIA